MKKLLFLSLLASLSNMSVELIASEEAATILNSTLAMNPSKVEEANKINEMLRINERYDLSGAAKFHPYTDINVFKSFLESTWHYNYDRYIRLDKFIKANHHHYKSYSDESRSRVIQVFNYSQQANCRDSRDPYRDQRHIEDANQNIKALESSIYSTYKKSLANQPPRTISIEDLLASETSMRGARIVTERNSLEHLLHYMHRESKTIQMGGRFSLFNE